MKWWLAGAGVLAMAGGGAAAMQAQRAAVSPAAVLPATQAVFDGYVRSGKLPGIVGAFGRGDAPTAFVAAGRIAYERDARRADADTLWRVYSMTKPITAAAAMVLIDDGKLTLDEPIGDVLPAFRRMRVQLRPDTLDSRPAARPITVRHLLTHTAGLGYSIVTTGPLLKAYEQAGILPGAISAPMEAVMAPRRPTSLQAFAERVARQPLIADPGTRWSYSIGLDVMAAVVERAAGMPFDRFVQTRLFTPLGMRSSYWTVPRSEAGRLATNYTFVGDAPVATDPGATSIWLKPPSFPYGGAGLAMSARDYDRFLHMLQDGGTLDGRRVLQPATAALMTSDLLPEGVVFSGAGVGGSGRDVFGARLGFGAGGAVVLEGPGKGTYGWEGAAGSLGWVNPAQGTRATVMVNYFPTGRYPLRREVVTALMHDAGARR